MAERIALDTGSAMLLDAIGAQVIRTEPRGEIALVLDLEGKLNKLDIRDAHRDLLSAGMAAELIAELVVAGEVAMRAGSPPSPFTLATDRFLADLEAAITARRDRLAKGTQ